MPNVPVSPNEFSALVALRGYIFYLLPDLEIVRGQGNLVPEPKGNDFIVLTPILRTRLETNIDTLGLPTGSDLLNGSLSMMAPTKLMVQADVHGPASGDNAQIVLTAFRDAFAAQWFTDQQIVGIMPLYTSDARQIPFINAEQQYENRWTLDLAMQINPVVTVPMQFAREIDVGLISIDVAYPPA
jgi:hypothetical protein